MSITRKRSVHRFDSLQQEAYLALWRTYDRLRAFEDDLFTRFEMTPQQYNVLRILKAVHPVTIPTSRLVGQLVSRAPDVTRMLDRLEVAGWISRTRGVTDRRAVLVAVTSAGLMQLEQITEPLANCHSVQFGHLSQEQLKSLIDLLRVARTPHEPAGSPWR